MTTFPVGGISGGKTKIAEKRKRQLSETDEDPSAKNRPKKKTYYQNFRQEYRTMYPALRSSAEGPQLAHCTVRKSDFRLHMVARTIARNIATPSLTHPSL